MSSSPKSSLPFSVVARNNDCRLIPTTIMATRTSNRPKRLVRRAAAATTATTASSPLEESSLQNNESSLQQLHVDMVGGVASKKNKPKRTAQEIEMQKRLVNAATDVYEKELERIFPNKVSQTFNQTLIHTFAGVTVNSITSLHRRRVKKQRQKDAQRSVVGARAAAAAAAIVAASAAMPNSNSSVKRSPHAKALMGHDDDDDDVCAETAAKASAGSSAMVSSFINSTIKGGSHTQAFMGNTVRETRAKSLSLSSATEQQQHKRQRRHLSPPNKSTTDNMESFITTTASISAMTTTMMDDIDTMTKTMQSFDSLSREDLITMIQQQQEKIAEQNVQILAQADTIAKIATLVNT